MPTSTNLVSISHLAYKSTLTVAIQVWLAVTEGGMEGLDHVSTFLLPQYILMPFPVTALIAYALHILS